MYTFHIGVRPFSSQMSKSQNGAIIEGVDAFEIIPRVVVGSYPSEKKFSPDEISDLDKLCLFLCKTYEKSLIVNLVAEKDIYSVDNELIELKHVFWKDNHAIALCEFVQIVYYVLTFLKDPKNGVFIHCKHGKGRTGTFVCALLILVENMTVEQANTFFARRRTLYHTGVKQKSQLRLLNYWKYLVDSQLPGMIQLKPKLWLLTKISLMSDKKDNFKSFIVKFASNEPYSTSKRLDYKEIGNLRMNKEYAPNLILSDDICFKITYENFMVKSYATCCFNCQMESLLQKKNECKTENGFVFLQFLFEDLDGVKGTQFKGIRYFHSVNLTLKEYRQIQSDVQDN